MTPTKVLGFVITLLVLAVPASATLLLNPDAETGDLTGWMVDESGASSGNTGIIQAVMEVNQSSGQVTPFQGDHFFALGVAPQDGGKATCPVGNSGCGDTISLFQEGVSGLGGSKFSLSGWFQTEGTDSGEAVLTFFDGGGTALSTASTGVLNNSIGVPNPSGWDPFGLMLPVPAGAAKWRLELFGTVNASRFTNVFYDDLRLAVPEPSSLFLLGSAIAALLVTRRRDGV